jgi:hypothetical protein
MEGFLKRKAMIGYSKEYYILQSSTLNSYKKKDSKIHKSLELKDIYVEIEEKSKTKRKFKILTSKDTFRIKADNHEERDKWF